ncbi:MAG: OmpA family protein [Gammaproteobacteria bacterium]|nr:MAG: OmpA family protein [Gammaproteobacteria bacterium]
MSDAPPAKAPESAGSPLWMATFADLMSLLMCFFVLLLSFSEMDAAKFKELAGSLSKAFGVQRDVPANELPKGTSVVTTEFSPGKPDNATLLKIMRQQTTDESKQNLNFTSGDKNLNKKEVAKEIYQAAVKRMHDEAKKITQILKSEIDSGIVEVEWTDREIVIRIRERGTFLSGDDKIEQEFSSLLKKIAIALNAVEGKIIVSGHTDNRPINTSRFPSNWVLSAARAAAVVHHLEAKENINPERLQIRAYGDIKPIFTNYTENSRSKNRRVEISILGNKSLLYEYEDVSSVIDN